MTAAGIDNVRFEARLLMSKASGLAIEEMISRGRDEVPASTIEALRPLAARRIRREPMAYILGEREFWGLPFEVTPDVLIPRPDSETVIEAALALLPDRPKVRRILDLGVGSGCLLLTLLREFSEASGVGVDVSPGALAVAGANARRLGVADRVQLIEGDWSRPEWMAPLGGPFDLVVSNPPYIESGAIAGLMPEVGQFEPKGALDGGVDGLSAYRLIAAAAPKLVAPGGWILVEAGQGQATEIKGFLSNAGLSPQGAWKDLAGIERVVPAKH